MQKDRRIRKQTKAVFFINQLGYAMKNRRIDARNNGGMTDYYVVPEDAKTLSDLIEHKSMEHGIGEAFAALYRLNDKDTRIRNLNKARFFIEREIDRELMLLRGKEVNDQMGGGAAGAAHAK
jgi:hypothetical protein